MTKLCPRGKAAAKRKFKVYPSAYANAYASKICAGKIKDPSGTKRKDWGPKKMKKGGGADFDTSGSRIKSYGKTAKVKIEKLKPKASYNKPFYRREDKADGGEIKINKVIKGLKKASRTHAAQAKTLETVKKADGGMIDMTKMKYV